MWFSWMPPSYGKSCEKGPRLCASCVVRIHPRCEPASSTNLVLPTTNRTAMRQILASLAAEAAVPLTPSFALFAPYDTLPPPFRLHSSMLRIIHIRPLVCSYVCGCACKREGGGGQISLVFLSAKGFTHIFVVPSLEDVASTCPKCGCAQQILVMTP